MSSVGAEEAQETEPQVADNETKEDHDSPAHDDNGDEDDRPNSAELTQDDRNALMGDNGMASRPATTGRMPSNLGRAALSRSTYVTNADYSSDDDDDEGQSVLITEVKDIPVSNQDIASWIKDDTGPSATRSLDYMTSQKIVEIDDDGYWDTDLEIEDEREEHDPTGRSQYAKNCERLGVVPVSYFTRHLMDTEIIMRYHGLGPLGTKAIAKALKTNITVERLNLTGNWMEGAGALYMADMLRENDYITYLTLPENKLGPDGAHHISKMLLVNTGLRSLDLSANGFYDESAGCIAEALEQNKYLKELILSRNHFEVDGGEILGPAIGANDVLDHLDLSWNLLRKNGAVAVARGLKENVRLKTCNLSWNGFGSQGGAAIADAIIVNESLLELDISGNRIDAETAAKIGQSLKKNEELKVLRIGNNPMTTTGCISLVTSINNSDFCTLQTLDMKEVPVEYEFLKIVEEIKKKRQFEVIHGPVLRSGNTSKDIGTAPIDPFKKKDPLLILREHIVVNDMRIFDILKRFDENSTYSVTPDQFAQALEELGVLFTKQQLDDISRKLDKGLNGRIFYGDMMAQIEAETKPNQRPSSNKSTSSRQRSAQSSGQPVVAKMQYAKRDTTAV